MKKSIIYESLILIILGLIAGAYFYGFNRGQIQKVQGYTAQQWASNYKHEASLLSKTQKEIHILKTQPTPTPEIQIETQYIPQPTPTPANTISKVTLICWMLTQNRGEGCPQ